MKRLLHAWLALLALTAASSARTHEFWMIADPFSLSSGASVRLTLHVGEYFNGESVPFSAGHAARLRMVSRAGTTDLMRRLPARAALPELRLRLQGAGTHLVMFDSHPSRIILPADKFHAYLHEEGLDAIIRAREEAGQGAAPGRERFRRNVKALLAVDGKADPTHAAITGQKLEILPLDNPVALKAGQMLRLRLLFDGRPLAGALVKAWHRRSDGGTEQTMMIRARAAADGGAAFRLPYAGTWMISAVHMVAAEGVPDIDWESYWANLTFALPG